MTLEIRPLRSDDEVLRAHRLELKCYPVELAATLEAFLYRWRAFPDLFLGAWEDGELIGLACGVRTDASDCSDVGIKKTHGGAGDGSKLCVLSVAVDPSRRRRGVGARLLRTLLGEARRIGLREAMLMCQASLIGWYGRAGFRETGLTHDEHGGVRWHDMAMRLADEPEA